MKTYTSSEISSPENVVAFEEIVQVLVSAFIDDASTKYLFKGHSQTAYLKVLPSYKRILVRLAIECDAIFTVFTKDDMSSAKTTTTTTTTSSHTDSDATSSPASEAKVSSSKDDPYIRAVAITIPPHGNKAFDSTSAAIRAGGWRLPLVGGLGMVYRLFRSFLPGIHQMHKHIFPDRKTEYDNWHLFYLATHVDNRGQGIGKKLLLEVQDMVVRANKAEAGIASQKHLEKGRDSTDDGDDDIDHKSKSIPKSSTNFAIKPLYLEASNANNKRLYNRVGFEDKSEMVYGKLKNGGNLDIAADGKVLGGRMFGLLWIPVLD